MPRNKFTCSRCRAGETLDVPDEPPLVAHIGAFIIPDGWRYLRLFRPVLEQNDASNDILLCRSCVSEIHRSVFSPGMGG